MWFLFLTAGALAGDLHDELMTLAERNAWVGVDRIAWEIEAGGGHLDADEVTLAIFAAQQLGDINALHHRAVGREGPQWDSLRAEIVAGYAPVVLVSSKRHPKLESLEARWCFSHHERQWAFNRAVRTIRLDGRYEGLLPANRYRLDGVEFEVVPGGLVTRVEAGQLQQP